jgi:hypothetical protein
MPVISALRRLKLEDNKFEASLGYVADCLKKPKKVRSEYLWSVKPADYTKHRITFTAT